MGSRKESCQQLSVCNIALERGVVVVVVGGGRGGGWGPTSSREPSLVNLANDARARVYIEAEKKKKKEKLQLSEGGK